MERKILERSYHMYIWYNFSVDSYDDERIKEAKLEIFQLAKYIGKSKFERKIKKFS